MSATDMLERDIKRAATLPKRPATVEVMDLSDDGRKSEAQTWELWVYPPGRLKYHGRPVSIIECRYHGIFRIDAGAAPGTLVRKITGHFKDVGERCRLEILRAVMRGLLRCPGSPLGAGLTAEDRERLAADLSPRSDAPGAN